MNSSQQSEEPRHANTPPIDLSGFAAFSRAFDEPDFVAGEWAGGGEVEPGLYQMAYWVPCSVVSEWEQTLYHQNVVGPDCDYMSEEFGAQMREFASDPSLLSASDLQVVRAALTNIVRGERFCEGYIGEMFDNGVAQAATRRLSELASAPEDDAERTHPT